MTPPIDKQQLASFIRMVTYMVNFMPHLSDHTEPLQAMLKQDVVFHWDEATNASSQKIKDLIAKSASQPLQYYDQTKTSHSTGRCLPKWARHLFSTGGKANHLCKQELTDTETRYANIERELLAIVFACQRFNTYGTWEAVHS